MQAIVAYVAYENVIVLCMHVLITNKVGIHTLPGRPRRIETPLDISLRGLVFDDVEAQSFFQRSLLQYHIAWHSAQRRRGEWDPLPHGLVTDAAT